jgi:hypothetical protein
MEHNPPVVKREDEDEHAYALSQRRSPLQKIIKDESQDPDGPFDRDQTSVSRSPSPTTDVLHIRIPPELLRSHSEMIVSGQVRRAPETQETQGGAGYTQGMSQTQTTEGLDLDGTYRSQVGKDFFGMFESLERYIG